MKRPFGKLWLDTFFPRKTMNKLPNQDLVGKTVIVTGGTDGMGRVAVERFAEMGADICLFGRSLKKTQGVVDELRMMGHTGQFSIVECDIGDLDQVRWAADEVLVQYRKIDILINCAGINLPERILSSHGHEMNFVINYLGPFLLTELLLERIRTTSEARIVHLTSATQKVAKLRFDDLHFERNAWSMLASYAQAKLCVIMHGLDLAERLMGSTVTIHCLNPGYIRTNLMRYSKGFERMFDRIFGGRAAPTWVGGERIVYVALDSQYREISGKYIYEDMLLDPNPLAMNEGNVARLMTLSQQMTGLTDTKVV